MGTFLIQLRHIRFGNSIRGNAQLFPLTRCLFSTSQIHLFQTPLKYLHHISCNRGHILPKALLEKPYNLHGIQSLCSGGSLGDISTTETPTLNPDQMDLEGALVQALNIPRTYVAFLVPKLEVLFERGCCPSQVFEQPRLMRATLLELTLHSVKQMVEWVAPHEPLTLPVFLIAAGCKGDERILRPRLQKYKKRMGGYGSCSDFLKHNLECTEEQLQKIFSDNPLLARMRQGNRIEQKIKMLLEHGCTMEEIHSHSQVLDRISVPTLGERLEIMKKLNISKVPLKAFGVPRKRESFEAYLLNYVNRSRVEVINTVQDLARYMGVSESLPVPQMELIPMKISMNNLHRKVQLLLAHGFTSDEILWDPRMLKLGLKKVEETLEEVKYMKVEKETLGMLYLFATDQSLNERKRDQVHLLEQLLDTSDLDLTKKMKSLICQQKSRVILDNYKFLSKECGFQDGELASCAWVLCHHPAVLHQHWGALQQELRTDASLSALDKTTTLNLLQFNIEKEMNFTQPIVFGETSEGES